jgi:hypothetical protein
MLLAAVEIFPGVVDAMLEMFGKQYHGFVA